EKSMGPDRELDALIVVALDLKPDWLKKSVGELWVDKRNADLISVRFRDSCIKNRGPGNPPIGDFASFTGSIDAAVTLVPEQYWWSVTDYRQAPAVKQAEASVHWQGGIHAFKCA